MSLKFSVTQNGRPLNKKLYNWDEDTKTFSTKENDLVLDFNSCNGVTFKTGSHCTFVTGYSCNFNTGDTCTFKTKDNCIFNAGSDCTFRTVDDCTFDTLEDCTFNTANYCVFKTWHSCTFTSGHSCVVIRKDVYEIIELPKYVKVVLNGLRIKGIKNKSEVMEALL